MSENKALVHVFFKQTGGWKVLVHENGRVSLYGLGDVSLHFESAAALKEFAWELDNLHHVYLEGEPGAN